MIDRLLSGRLERAILTTELYGIETRALTQEVQRNLSRFSADFMFQMSDEEVKLLRSQIVISKKRRGGRRYLPYAFTEQGVAMLSSVLNSERAVEINIEIMRAFVRLREMLLTHKDLARKLDALERKFESHEQTGRSDSSSRKDLHATERDKSSHFDVSGILETWRFRLESVLERLNLEHLNRLRSLTTERSKAIVRIERSAVLNSG